MKYMLAAQLCAAASLALGGNAAVGQSISARALADAALIDVPLVLSPTPATQTAASLWVNDKPADTLLARFEVMPVQVAALRADASGSRLLWRAFPGGGLPRLRAVDLQLDAAPRTFCGDGGADGALGCFVDRDGDGSFDAHADAIYERGSRPYHATILRAATPLPAPLPYRILPDAERPRLAVELRNCERDYDRPRYSARSVDDRTVPVAQTSLGWLTKDSSLATCRRGAQLADTGATPPAGGYVAQLGPFAFTVGPKRDPAVKLVGAVDSSALYRLEGASLVEVRVGHTPDQAQLLALKAYPFPTLMTDEGATFATGAVAKGGRIASLPFHHAYRGKLTQEIAIRTLLGKRALPAGTIVYGFASRSRMTATVNGMPIGQVSDDAAFREVRLELTWCAPVHDQPSGKERPNMPGRNGWSAACVPHSMFGKHTIITNLQPGFGVEGVSYDATTSSNDGPPPIERSDESRFDRPLRVDYLFDGREGDYLVLDEQMFFGDELTSSQPKRLYAPKGSVGITVAGAAAVLSATAEGGVTVSASGPPQLGANPRLAWDQRAWMLDQLKRLGLKLPPGELEPTVSGPLTGVTPIAASPPGL